MWCERPRNGAVILHDEGGRTTSRIAADWEGVVVLEPVTSRWDRLVERVREEAAARSLTEEDVTDEIAAMRGSGVSASENPGDETP